MTVSLTSAVPRPAGVVDVVLSSKIMPVTPSFAWKLPLLSPARAGTAAITPITSAAALIQIVFARIVVPLFPAPLPRPHGVRLGTKSMCTTFP
ncbi:protein of unknown function [Hyphomicrobium sp. 1Nfss2.1]